MPRGGRRPGSGRKPKGYVPSEVARVLAHPSVPVVTPSSAPVEPFDPPPGLSDAVRAVWEQQAPHAFGQRTLTKASALAFERYCRVVVLEQEQARSAEMGGSNHRGLLQLVNNYELQFLLTPNGRPMPEPAAATAVDTGSKLAKFRA